MNDAKHLQPERSKTKTMTEELEQLLKNLKLRRMLNVYDEQLKAAEKANPSYSIRQKNSWVDSGSGSLASE
jgi:hypothetical protein